MKRLFGFSNDFRSTDKLQCLRDTMQRLKGRAEDFRTQVRNEELQASKKQKREVSLWLEEVDSMKEKLQIIETEIENGGHSGVGEKLQRMVETAENLVKQGEFPRGLVLDGFNPEGLELVTEKLEGSTPSDVQGEIWGSFERGQVRVGLHGMGGVGKTSVAMHINNKILIEKDTIFRCVFYVTVSRDTNVYKLQSDIAKAFELGKLEYDDETKRAAELKQALTKREGSLLILDDVWEGISMAAIGVCVEGDGCKLLITTRQKEVCHKMSCFPVKINPLSDEESWALFKKQLGNYEELPGEVQQIARLVAKECDGLPLGIITMAGCMRGERMEYRWSDALRTLRDPSSSQHDTDMEDDVFKILRFSYYRLKDEKLKKCFLYCALYPEDSMIQRDELIRQLMGEGLLDGSRREEKIDRGHTLLKALENASLLECETYSNCVKMHDLVRDMAIKIIGSTGLVKGGNSLKEVPEELQCVNENLEWVSLMGNQIEEIGNMTSPDCPNVSVLLLQDNYLLRLISESFFSHMIGLNVLNLCRTDIKELPDSVSDLANLKCLLLSDCKSLYYIPPIGKLTKLRELALQGCWKLSQLPDGVEELVSLESFESNCQIVVQEPNELLSLRHLTRLSGVILSSANWVNHCIDLSGLNRVKTYSVWVRDDDDDDDYELLEVEGSKTICVQDCRLEVMLQVPENVEFLKFYDCKFEAKSLLDIAPSLRGGSRTLAWIGEEEVHPFVSLRILEITRCEKLKKLWMLNINLPNLEKIDVQDCEQIEEIFAAEKGATIKLPRLRTVRLRNLPELSSICDNCVSCPELVSLEVGRCNKAKKLLRLNIGLPNLEKIDVKSCKQMEQVFATEKGAIIDLPRLRTVELRDLPELRSICDNCVSCPDLVSLEVGGCNKAKKLLVLNTGPPNLEEIQVFSCEQVEEVFATEKGATIELPSLRSLSLLALPELRSICNNVVFCPGLVSLQVKRCNKVKKLGLLLSHNDNLNSLRSIHVSNFNETEELFVVGDTSEDDPVQFPSVENLPELTSICSFCVVCPTLVELTVALLSHILPSLAKLRVSYCDQIEELFPVEEDLDVTAVAIQWPNLKTLDLSDLAELRSICRKTLLCDSLELVEVKVCPKVKKIALLSHRLPSLAELHVSGCNQIEEIFATGEDVDVTTAAIQCPNLKKLRLIQLPELRSICRKTIVCNSLEVVELDHRSCCKLENFPISIPRLTTTDSNGENHYSVPRFVGRNMYIARWLALNWNDNDTKTILSERGSLPHQVQSIWSVGI